MADSKKTALTLEQVDSKKLRKTLADKMRDASEYHRTIESLTNRKKDGLLDVLKTEIVDLLMQCGADSMNDGESTQSIFNGANVSISEDRLRTSLMKHAIDPTIAAAIIAESKSRKEYTTLTIKENQ